MSIAGQQRPESSPVTIVDTGDQKVIGVVFVGRDPNWIDLTPDGGLAVVGDTGCDDVNTIGVAQRKVVAAAKVGSSAKRLTGGVAAMNRVWFMRIMCWKF